MRELKRREDGRKTVEIAEELAAAQVRRGQSIAAACSARAVLRALPAVATVARSHPSTIESHPAAQARLREAQGGGGL